MIRRFCFSCALLFFVSIVLSGSAFAQFRVGVQNIPPLLRKTSPPSMLNTWAHYGGKTTPLSKPFATLDTFDFGGLPENVWVYGTFSVSNSTSKLVQLAMFPLTARDEIVSFKALDDSGLEYPYIEPKGTTDLRYAAAVDPQAYNQYYPKGGAIIDNYIFLYADAYQQVIYQGDTVAMVADPLPFDSVGHAPVVKLLHRKTETLPILITGNEVPDITAIPPFTDSFYIENAEKDSLEVTTARYWGNVIFTGETQKTPPFKLGPGERATVYTHFTPGIPDTQPVYYADNMGNITDSDMVPYFSDEFIFGTDQTLKIDFASNVTASGYHPSRLALGASALSWQHPDPAANESAQVGSSYHLVWSINGAPTNVNVEYAYQSSGTQTWKSITKNSSATSYDWTLPSTPGTIDIRVASTEQGVTPMITHLTLTSNAGVGGPSTSTAVEVYPNPVASTLRISGLNAQTVTLLDMLGRVALQSKMVAGKATLDCSKLAIGNYMLRLGSEIRPITIAR